jgi:hypothetical protein
MSHPLIGISRSPATFSRRPAPEYGRGVELIEVDCPHGTTSCILLAPSWRPPSDREVRLAAAAAVWRHHDAEGCACTRRLRRLYSRDGAN